MNTPASSQASLRASDYRERIPNHLNKDTPSAFAAPARDYTPGITSAPKGDTAVATQFPYRTKMALQRQKGVLSVSASGAFTGTGAAGGPFNVNSRTYTITNTGGAALEWAAEVDETWLEVSDAAGTLAPGASTTVTVDLNADADELTADAYTATISFTNTGNSGIGDTDFAVSLTVTA